MQRIKENGNLTSLLYELFFLIQYHLLTLKFIIYETFSFKLPATECIY